jgi:hypothetical protein
MLLMPLSAGAGIALGLARGGRLASVGDVQLRAWPLLGLAVVVQLGLGAAPAGLRLPLVLGCAAASAAWAFINARAVAALRFGLVLVAVGVVLNAAVIGANGGMPVDTNALPLAGLGGADVADGFLFKHVPMSDSTSLRWLGDVIPVAVKPFRSVISLGDIVMLAGIALTSAQATAPIRRTLAVRG